MHILFFSFYGIESFINRKAMALFSCFSKPFASQINLDILFSFIISLFIYVSFLVIITSLYIVKQNKKENQKSFLYISTF